MCPNCGYCEKCGRSNLPKLYPGPFPYYPIYPWWQYQQYPLYRYDPNTVTSSSTSVGQVFTSGTINQLSNIQS